MLCATAGAKDFHLLFRTYEFLLHGLRRKERYVPACALRALSADNVSSSLNHLTLTRNVGNPHLSRSALEFLEFMDQYFKVWPFVDIMNVDVANDALLIDHEQRPF